MKKLTSVPTHFCVLHSRCSSSLPGQGFPSPTEGGLLQRRYRYCFPPPQDWSHCCQDPQSPHPPSMSARKKMSSNITTVNEHFCFRKKSLNSREPLCGEYLSLRTILKCIYVIYVFCIYSRLLSLAWSQNDSRSGLICNRYINIAKQNHQFFFNKVCEKNTSLS